MKFTAQVYQEINENDPTKIFCDKTKIFLVEALDF